MTANSHSEKFSSARTTSSPESSQPQRITFWYETPMHAHCRFTFFRNSCFGFSDGPKPCHCRYRILYHIFQLGGTSKTFRGELALRTRSFQPESQYAICSCSPTEIRYIALVTSKKASISSNGYNVIFTYCATPKWGRKNRLGSQDLKDLERSIHSQSKCPRV